MDCSSVVPELVYGPPESRTVPALSAKVQVVSPGQVSVVTLTVTGMPSPMQEPSSMVAPGS